MARRKESQIESSLPGTLLGLVILIVAIGLIYLAWDWVSVRKDGAVFRTEQPNARACHDASVAYRAMQRFALQQLPFPRGAQFPPKDAISIGPSGADCSYVITGYVDIQNDRGLRARTQYRGLISYDFPRDGWRLERFEHQP